jgi:hypothetical protein
LRERILKALQFIAVIVAFASASAWAQPQQDALARLAGTWEIVSASGSTGCDRGQTFTPTADNRYVTLDQHDAEGADNSRYIVLQVHNDRVLMFIEGEERLTAQGDPVIWWAVFDGPNTFRWRRYDWPATALTDALWRRCTT